MTRPAWIEAFIDELQKLRPHLQQYGTSKVAHALALNAYDPKIDPKAAARKFHEQQEKR